MTTYYADFDLGTGNNDGTDAANAWQTMSDVIAGSNGTAPAAGDTVLCKGTDSTSAVVAWTISGTYNGGYVKLIGVDASWANVGGSTRAVIDRGGGASVVLSLAAGYVWLENFEITGGGSSGTSCHGIQTPSGAYREYNVFVNCYVHDNYGEGFDANGGYGRYSTFIKCRSSNNAVCGFADWKDSEFHFCRADNNSSNGFFPMSTKCLLNKCVAEDNGGDGLYNYYGAYVIDSVFHGNTDDAIGYPYASGASMPCGVRATGNAVGINASANLRIPVFCYYGDNTTEISGYYDEVLNDGDSTVTLNGTDTDEGYTDSASSDFNLTSDATYRRVEVAIP